MKKILIGLFVVACGSTISAQSTITSKSATQTVQKDNSKEDAAITDALMKDKDLQAQTVKYLRSSKATGAAMTEIGQKVNGDNKAMMELALRDKSLAQAAVNYVKSQPELMKKVKAIASK